MLQRKALVCRLASTALILTVLIAFPRSISAETPDDKVVRTGSGPIGQKMIDAAVWVVEIQDVPAALVPSGCQSLWFFVTPDPAAPDKPAVLLAGKTAKGELKALARLAYAGDFEGKVMGRCSDRVLILSIEYPYSTAVLETRWSWDGKTAKSLGATESDPQKGIADTVRALIKKGDLAAALGAVQGTLYPDSYLDAREIGPLLLQLGYKKAMTEYKAGKPDQAAKLLSGIFLTDQSAGLLDVKSREEYLTAGYGTFLSFEEFIAIQNDYGFFLEQSSDPRAVGILSRTIILDPGRAVAFLNLADALWKAGKRTEAAADYREYARLMKEKGVEKMIPSRVMERSSG
jgi:hypothetical protein